MQRSNDVNRQDLKETVSVGKGNILGHALGNGILGNRISGSVPGGVAEARTGKAYTNGGFREG